MADAVANSKLAQIIDTVKALTVMELSDLVHALEKEFGVSAAAVAVAAPGGGGAAAAAEAEPTVFKVTLTAGGPNKIQVIKAIREITGLGLADAKAFVEGAPKMVKDGLEKGPAEELAKKIKETGAEVKVEGA
ncbi:MAG: 50S ribosomal protein L7/L12 [Planctomycetes bacterium]|nr:50S ribosomal protein L7/L12 [Planctomycetota bacterium]